MRHLCKYWACCNELPAPGGLSRLIPGRLGSHIADDDACLLSPGTQERTLLPQDNLWEMSSPCKRRIQQLCVWSVRSNSLLHMRADPERCKGGKLYAEHATEEASYGVPELHDKQA